MRGKDGNSRLGTLLFYALRDLDKRLDDDLFEWRSSTTTLSSSRKKEADWLIIPRSRKRAGVKLPSVVIEMGDSESWARLLVDARVARERVEPPIRQIGHYRRGRTRSEEPAVSSAHPLSTAAQRTDRLCFDSASWSLDEERQCSINDARDVQRRIHMDANRQGATHALGDTAPYILRRRQLPRLRCRRRRRTRRFD